MSDVPPTTGYGAKRHAHSRALEEDIGQDFTTGEEIEVIVSEPPEKNGGDEAYARVSRPPANDVAVFIDPGDFDLHRGDQIRCRISACLENCLKAVAIWKVD